MSPSTGRTIAVVGATGRQGGQVVQRLLADGWHVRAITRKPGGKNAAKLNERGAEVFEADLDDPKSLDSAFAGAHGVFNVQAPHSGSIEIEIRQARMPPARQSEPVSDTWSTDRQGLEKKRRASSSGMPSLKSHAR